MAKVANSGGLFFTGRQAITGSFTGLTVMSTTNIGNITFGEGGPQGPIQGIPAGTTLDVLIRDIRITGSVLLYT